VKPSSRSHCPGSLLRRDDPKLKAYPSTKSHFSYDTFTLVALHSRFPTTLLALLVSNIAAKCQNDSQYLYACGMKTPSIQVELTKFKGSDGTMGNNAVPSFVATYDSPSSDKHRYGSCLERSETTWMRRPQDMCSLCSKPASHNTSTKELSRLAGRANYS
jgi:hypothetical protein